MSPQVAPSGYGPGSADDDLLLAVALAVALDDDGLIPVLLEDLRNARGMTPNHEPIAGVREVASPTSGLTSCAAGSTSAVGITRPSPTHPRGDTRAR